MSEALLHEIRQLAARLGYLASQAPIAARRELELLDAAYSEDIASESAEHEKALAEIRRTTTDTLRAILQPLKEVWSHAGDRWEGVDATTALALRRNGGTNRPIRFGELQIGQHITVPLVASIIGYSHLILSADDKNDVVSASTFQSICLRCMCLAPSPVNWRFIDLVDHGRRFAPFLQRVPSLATGVITTPSLLDECIKELFEEIGERTRYCLNNETPSILEYNFKNPQSARPIYLIFWDHWLPDLTPALLHRLEVVFTSGPVAGVCIFMRGRLSDIHETQTAIPGLLQAYHLILEDRREIAELDGIRVADGLILDKMPEDGKVRELLNEINAHCQSEASDGGLHLLPNEELWWKGRHDTCVEVPIGVDAHRNAIWLRFDEAEHVAALVLGDSGCGKSNLLHVIVTQLVLRYSPNDVAIYLLDLKGVEFIQYADAQIPHFKMIACNMDQELGLAALRDLKKELLLREKLFRSARAKLLSAYNQQEEESIQRIVVVVDEFQRLFDANDRLGNEAAGIVEQLLRQGRSFGIHLVMSSQRLSGRNLPANMRSLFNERICVRLGSQSEYELLFGDAKGIGDELKTPGDAYFMSGSRRAKLKVPFLSPNTHSALLSRLTKVAAERGQKARTVVLDGEETADITRNYDLRWRNVGTAQSSALLLWVGEGFALTNAIAVNLLPQLRANVVLVGQDEFRSEAMTICAACALSAILQAHGNIHVTILLPNNGESAGNVFTRLADNCPESVSVIASSDAEVVIDLIRRIKERGTDANGRRSLLIVCGIHLIPPFNKMKRSLTVPLPGIKGQTDPGEQVYMMVRDLLTQGPMHGTHTVVWANSPGAFDRELLSNFAHRMAFRLPESESRVLFDSPVADGLGVGRAALRNIDAGSEAAIVRPYKEIPLDWLDSLLLTIPER